MLPAPPPLPYDMPTLTVLTTRLSNVMLSLELPAATVHGYGVGPAWHAPQQKTERHIHRFYEGFLVVDGAMDIITPWYRQQLGAGHIMLFSPGTIHQWQTHHQHCLCLVFSFEVDRQLTTPSRQHWPCYPELLWTNLLLWETVRGEGPHWPRYAHGYLGVIYTYLLGLIDETDAAYPPVSRSSQLVQRIDELLSADLMVSPTLEMLAGSMAMSIRHLTRLYQALTGTTIHARLHVLRMERAAKLLLNTNLAIAEVARTVGISHAGYFAQRFCEYFENTPRAYREQASMDKPIR